MIFIQIYYQNGIMKKYELIAKYITDLYVYKAYNDWDLSMILVLRIFYLRRILQLVEHLKLI